MRRGGTIIACIISVFLLLVGPLQAGAGEQSEVHSDLQLLLTVRAASYLGIAYHYGGEDARGLDCSGFIHAMYGDLIPDLPRRSKELFDIGVSVGVDELQPGDLVFFNTTGENPSHVGIYIGKKHFIHAASAGEKTGVIISSLSQEYYKTRYSGARRIRQLVRAPRKPSPAEIGSSVF